MKKCSKCGVSKPLSEYNKNAVSKDGHRPDCKICVCARAKKYRDANREEVLRKQREYYKNNPEKKREQDRLYYNKNKKELLEKQKAYRIENQEKISDANKKKLKENPNYYKEIYRRNLEGNRQRRRVYNSQSWRNNIQHRIAKNTRKRIIRALNGTVKNTRLVDLLGCSINDFKRHIESQFTEGMTWDNYTHSGWHMDHIVPCNAFDLTDQEQQKLCFHYTNLQPLWARDNLVKGAKLPHEWQREK